MSLFDRLFPKPQELQVNNYFKLLNGYTPVFHGWRAGLYESELVRASIDARARHIGKLLVEPQGSARQSLQRQLLKAPNGFQTWYQFLYRLSTILDVRNTAFVVPTLDIYGDIIGIYPILPAEYSLVESQGVPYLRFKFEDGNHAAMELSHVGIMTKFQYNSDLFGTDNKALIPTMDLITIQNQGIKEGVTSAASFRFMAQMSNFANEADLKKERDRFAETNLSSGNGFLLWPNTYKDIKQIDSNPFIVDADQVKLIQNNVYNYFGVNEDILQNKVYGDKWAAFYEGAIEPFAIQFSEVVTKMLFTDREQSQGNSIMATSNRLQYMTTQEKLNVSAQLSDRGVLNRDEVRSIWNLPPLPNDEGKAYIIRGEYKNADEQINEGGSGDGSNQNS